MKLRVTPAGKKVFSRVLLTALIGLQAAAGVFTEFQVYTFSPFESRIVRSGEEAVSGPRSPAGVNLLTDRLLWRWSALLGRAGVPPGWAFAFFRFFQNVLILFLAVRWWRRLGISPPRAGFGLLLCGWGLMYAFPDRRPEPELYSAAIFFLLGALLSARGRGKWLPLPVLGAALDTPAFVFLPLLYLATSGGTGSDAPGRRERWAVFSVSLLLGLAAFFWTVSRLGWRWGGPIWGHAPGLDLLRFNLAHGLTQTKVLWFCGLLPALALLNFSAWPGKLKGAAAVSLLPVFLALATRFLPETRVLLIPLVLLLIPGFLLPRPAGYSRALSAGVVILAASASLCSQVWILGGVHGRYLRESQIERHLQVLSGEASSPWRYRVLSEYPVEGALRVAAACGLTSPGIPLVAVRLLQNLLIFGLARRYWRLLGFSREASAWGLVLAGWGMGYAFFNSDLSFSTYTDLIFYLLGGILLLRGRIRLFPPLVFLAALNRETGVLLPALALPGWEKSPARTARVFLLSLLVFFSVFWLLRYCLPGTSFSQTWGEPGFGRLLGNISRGLFWRNFLLVANLTPLLALAFFPRWGAPLRGIFLFLVPAWIFLHLYAKACPEETRFLLVPLFLVFVPGVLRSLSSEGLEPGKPVIRDQ